MIESVSLDEYIRKKKAEGDSPFLLGYKKWNQNVSKEALDKSLDQYIKASGVVQTNMSNTTATTTKSGSKFDRIRYDSAEESDEEDLQDTLIIKKEPESDVEMKDANEEGVEVKSDEEESRDQLGELRRFTTAETRQGIRVRSQQWRMLPENLVDRPEGVRRLECLPLDESERYRKRFGGVRDGRVQKNYRSRNSSVTMSASSSLSDISTQGRFIEKGQFTFKVGEDQGLIGIERNRSIVPQVEVQAPVMAAPPPQITINMNWDGFHKGMQEMQKAAQPKEPTSDHDVVSAAMALLRNIEKAKRARENGGTSPNPQIQRLIETVPGQPVNNFRQVSVCDDEIDLLATPHSTGVSLTSRFA